MCQVTLDKLFRKSDVLSTGLLQQDTLNIAAEILDPSLTDLLFVKMVDDNIVSDVVDELRVSS